MLLFFKTILCTLGVIMRKLIEKIESANISVFAWMGTFICLNVIRLIFESFSGSGFLIAAPKDMFLHAPLYFGCAILSSIILIHLLTKVEIVKVLKVAIVGLVIILTPPIVDFIISGGSGTYQIRYLLVPLNQLIIDFFTFFGPGLTSVATYGTRFQVFCGMTLIGIYVYIKTKSRWKAALGVFASYTIAFFYGSLTTTVGLLMSLPKNPWKVTTLDLVQKFITGRSIFAIEYPPDKILELFSVEMGLILLPFLSIQLLVIFYLWDKKKFIAFFKKLRYLRLAFQYLAVIIGIVLGLRIYHARIDTTLYGILTLFALFVTATSVWIFSLTTNDLNDVEIDKISNKDRLLPTGIFTVTEFKVLATISGALALIASYTVGYTFALFTFGNLVFAYIYSFEPLRLRKWPIISSGLMAVGTAFLVIMSFMLFAPPSYFGDFPVNMLALLVFVVALVMNVKDIKDIEGDSQNGIFTIPTLFGDKLGKVIISLLFVLSFLLFPIILHNKELVVSSIIFAVFTSLIINSKKVNEHFVFGTYLLFLVVVAVTIS